MSAAELPPIDPVDASDEVLAEPVASEPSRWPERVTVGLSVLAAVVGVGYAVALLWQALGGVVLAGMTAVLAGVIALYREPAGVFRAFAFAGVLGGMLTLALAHL